MLKTARHALTKEELTELPILLRQVFDFISQLKAQNPAAAPIQYPKLPSIFSESLVLHCGPAIFPNAQNLRRGGAVADILFEVGQLTKKVEVKATGQQAFQYFGKKDIDADFLVWLAFGEFFRSQAESHVKIYVLAKPGEVLPNPTKISLATFERQAAGKLVRYKGSLRDIIEGRIQRGD
ncbi:MAG TPA: hypothetical protein VMW05_12855 [Methyloceanibacter sp.]|nr:hypothetical protein [Methyloceanibacter sp.]